MSVIKSQIHDGFATIRTRGLHRSRSRTEQLEKLKPVVVKSDSVPLYENNNDLLYNFKKAHPMEVASPDLPAAANMPSTAIPGNESPDYETHFSPLSASCNSFKQSIGALNGRTSDAPAGSFEDLKTPPPISPCYENITSNGFHTPKTPDSTKAFDYYPYQRPESPAYGQIKLRENGINSIDLYQLPPARVFTPTYYRKDADALDYALTKVTAAVGALSKPPIKSNSLHYRKSYSHPGKTIYEDTSSSCVKLEPTSNVARYYSSSNYYSPSEISDGSSHKSSNSELFNERNLRPPLKYNGYEKRYATLSYPKETQRFRQQQRFSTSHVETTANAELEYFDPLDCKIGCQTTLRSKPRIPWYELAIKKDIRRQSCPPNNEVNFFMPIFNNFFSSQIFLFKKSGKILVRILFCIEEYNFTECICYLL